MKGGLTKQLGSSAIGPVGFDRGHPATISPTGPTWPCQGSETGEASLEPSSILVELTRGIVGSIRQQTSIVDFWRNRSAQERLRGSLLQYLDDRDAAPF